VSGAPSPLSAMPKGYGDCSTKNKAARILADTPRAISPCMRRSFIDRQYSPSTGKDRREWEIILEELTCMGLIVKKEHVSDGCCALLWLLHVVSILSQSCCCFHAVPFASAAFVWFSL
jgi:hypothetical protein